MKQLTIWISIICLEQAIAQNVAINNSGQVGHSSSILDVFSEDKGLLIPRMTTNQRNDILNPAIGLAIFNLTSLCFEFYNGLYWYNMCQSQSENIISQYPLNYVHCNPNKPTPIQSVQNPSTGKIWMDRNLGASLVANSVTDAQSYGSFFQWGRRADGHQCVNRFTGDGVTTSTNTAVNATVSNDTPNHGNFIPTNTGNNDWRSSQNNNLWQGAHGVNNPCPLGFRLPTESEFNAERLSWTSNNALGAFNSTLKLPLAGYRSNGNGLIFNTEATAHYWTSTTTGVNARYLLVNTTNSSISTFSRSYGFSVRCIKN